MLSAFVPTWDDLLFRKAISEMEEREMQNSAVEVPDRARPRKGTVKEKQKRNVMKSDQVTKKAKKISDYFIRD